MFTMPVYHAPDFTERKFADAPDITLVPAPKDGVVPENYHATTIFPEYFKVNGQWLLAAESRMDCTAVYEDGKILVVEPRRIAKGSLVVTGRTENAEDGIYVHASGFEGPATERDLFAFRQGRSRETADSSD